MKILFVVEPVSDQTFFVYANTENAHPRALVTVNTLCQFNEFKITKDGGIIPGDSPETDYLAREISDTVDDLVNYFEVIDKNTNIVIQYDLLVFVRVPKF